MNIFGPNDAKTKAIREMFDRGDGVIRDQDAAVDRAYYEGARQYQRMASQSVSAADDWVLKGCGGRGPDVSPKEPSSEGD